MIKMEKSIERNIKLGVFVLVGILFFILTLYFIGINKSIFSSTVRISAKFYNAEGLAKGNNVRLMGIDIGTVEDVQIINDTLINVTMVIKKQAADFIKKNSMVKIGTDGLMGNKLVKIEPLPDLAPIIKEGDVLLSERAIEATEMLQTLYKTNENVNTISEDLKQISSQLTSDNSLWNLLSDTNFRNNFQQTILSVRETSNNTALVTENLNKITRDIQSGKGILGEMISDTSIADNFKETTSKINEITLNVEKITGELRTTVRQINKGEGAVATLLNDTSFVNDLNQTMQNLNTGSKAFSENMEALQKSFLLRKYFRDNKEK